MTATAAFSIGDFVFESFHEYRDGQEDLKKIEAINGELDIQDPEVAVRLYHLIRGGDISFKTAIGDDFAEHIADIVAEKFTIAGLVDAIKNSSIFLLMLQNKMNSSKKACITTHL